MKVGIIGSGGREHAICESIKNSSKIKKIFCFPGNAGTENIAENTVINIENFDLFKKLIKKNNIDIIIVGPEKPLVNGIVDFLEKNDDVVLLDTRNDYEIELGTFKNALEPPIKTFKQFKDYVSGLENLKDKGVIAVSMGKQLVRFVMHLDVSDEQFNQLKEIIKDL